MIGIWAIGFVAGLITGISPCVLPVFPIVLLSWTTEPGGEQALRASRRRAMAVLAGLVVSFSVTVLAGVALLNALHLPDDLLQRLGLGLLALIGVGLLIPAVGHVLERPFSRIRIRPPSGTASGFLLGLGLGAVFVPCAGPILTAITVAGVHKTVGYSTVVMTICFSVGAVVPMFFVALAGDALIERNRKLRARAQRWRPVGGAILVLMAAAIFFNWVSGAQTWLPGYTNALQNGVENTCFVKAQLHDPRLCPSSATGSSGSTSANLGMLMDCQPESSSLQECGVAPTFVGITKWLNTPGDVPLTLAALHGHVVLVDFWTYSCINCQRTLPHVEAWYQRYHAYGLDIIGVQAPEFAFEHVVSNVASAVQSLGVDYPVAIDNNLDTWTAYDNDSWPAEYLIDAKGVLRHYDDGEGGYTQTESFIRSLLEAANPTVHLPPPTNVPNETPTSAQSPETYLGWEDQQGHEASYFVDTLVPNEVATYSLGSSTPEGYYSLGGEWDAESESCVAVKNAALNINFLAHHVYLVLGGTGVVDVNVNGVRTSLHVSGYPRLYTLFNSANTTQATMHLTFSPGIAAYDFTFG